MVLRKTDVLKLAGAIVKVFTEWWSQPFPARRSALASALIGVYNDSEGGGGGAGIGASRKHTGLAASN